MFTTRHFPWNIAAWPRAGCTREGWTATDFPSTVNHQAPLCLLDAPRDVSFVPLSSNRPILTHHLPTERYFRFTISQLRAYHEQHSQMFAGTVEMNHARMRGYCRHFTHDHEAFVCSIFICKMTGALCVWAAVNTDQRGALLQHATFDSNTCQILTAAASTHMTWAPSSSLLFKL